MLKSDGYVNTKIAVVVSSAMHRMPVHHSVDVIRTHPRNQNDHFWTSRNFLEVFLLKSDGYVNAKIAVVVSSAMHHMPVHHSVDVIRTHMASGKPLTLKFDMGR